MYFFEIDEPEFLKFAEYNNAKIQNWKNEQKKDGFLISREENIEEHCLCNKCLFSSVIT